MGNLSVSNDDSGRWLCRGGHRGDSLLIHEMNYSIEMRHRSRPQTQLRASMASMVRESSTIAHQGASSLVSADCSRARLLRRPVARLVWLPAVALPREVTAKALRFTIAV
jgi:hypothetical protein